MTHSKRTSWQSTGIWLLAIVGVFAGVAWWIQPEAVPVPKPEGQVRLTLPDTTSASYTSPCNTSYRVPTQVKVEVRSTPPDEEGCWYNLVFPRFKARVHCTEKPVNNGLPELIQDAQSLVFGHEVAAAGIRRHALDLPEKSGMIFVLEGPVAAPIQFFVTDSTSHFMRGSLYFNHAPNPDSTAPVLERMEADIRRIMESLSWS